MGTFGAALGSAADLRGAGRGTGKGTRSLPIRTVPCPQSASTFRESGCPTWLSANVTSSGKPSFSFSSVLPARCVSSVVARSPPASPCTLTSSRGSEPMLGFSASSLVAPGGRSPPRPHPSAVSLLAGRQELQNHTDCDSCPVGFDLGRWLHPWGLGFSISEAGVGLSTS